MIGHLRVRRSTRLGRPAAPRDQWPVRRPLTLRRERALSVAMLVPAVALLIGTSVFPIVSSLRSSLFETNPNIPGLEPRFVGIENYTRLFEDPVFLDSLRFTAIFVAIAVTLEIVLGLAVGVLISRRTRMTTLARVALLIPFALAPIAAGILWKTLFSSTWGPINWLLGTIGLPRQNFLGSSSQALPSLLAVEVWQQMPAVAFIIAAGVVSLPTDLFRAAQADGASAWQTFRRITLPLLRPVIFVVLVLRVMDAFKTYDIIVALTNGGPAQSTESITFLIAKEGFRYFHTGYAAAMSWVLLVIIMIVSIPLIRGLERAQRAGGADL